MKTLFQIGCLWLILLCEIKAIYGSSLTAGNTKNLDHVSISLLTLGSDEFLYSSWGHSTLRVRDDLNGTDITYNWGVFDQNSPLFLWRFIKETLPYKLDVLPTKYYLGFILKLNDRRVVEDKIILNDEQKKNLLKKLSWWMKPENQYYRYHSYKDNCSTQIRDLLNETLNNQIKDKYENRKTSQSWRTYWQDYFLHWPITKFAGDLVFNKKIDKKISAWEEMFIPDKLREHLISYGIASPAKVWVDIPALQTPGISAITWFSILFLIPVGLFIRGTAKNSKRLIRISLALLCLIWGCFSGVFGFTIAFISLFTERDYFHFGANSWILIILDWWLIWPSWKLLRNQTINTKILEKIGIIHLMGVAAYLVLWAAGSIEQDITIPMQSIVPACIIFSIILIFVERRKKLVS